jgi:hypothetical protein
MYPFGKLLFATPAKKGNKAEEPMIRPCDLQLIEELLQTPVPENPFLAKSKAMLSELGQVQVKNAAVGPYAPPAVSWEDLTPSIQNGMDCVHQCADIGRTAARIQLGVQLSQAICFLATGYVKNAHICIHLAQWYAEAAGLDFSLKRDFDDRPTDIEKAVESLINRLVGASALVEYEQKGMTPVRTAV